MRSELYFEKICPLSPLESDYMGSIILSKVFCSMISQLKFRKFLSLEVYHIYIENIICL